MAKCRRRSIQGFGDAVEISAVGWSEFHPDGLFRMGHLVDTPGENPRGFQDLESNWGLCHPVRHAGSHVRCIPVTVQLRRVNRVYSQKSFSLKHMAVFRAN